MKYGEGVDFDKCARYPNPFQTCKLYSGVLV